MREFTRQSESVLQQLLGQMDTLMDGSLRTVHMRFEHHDVAFREIYSKHAIYDDIQSRRQQQGKGASSERTCYQEARVGLIHEKDIKMPIFPDKCENTEVFRRWWKDVAEYCERSPQFPGCTFVFKKTRGY